MKKYCTDEVTSILDKIPIVKNKARKKFVILFILALIKTRKVQFCEIAEELNPDVLASSNETRIQDFFREVSLDYEKVALLLAFFLPKRGKVTLCIDRTEWDFGKCQVNFLMIVVRCKHITIPLYSELLDNNSGNSNTDDRIDLLKKCVALLGANMGLHHHLRVKFIPVKNHGYKQNSFSRTGINIIREGIRRKWRICFQYFLDFVIRFLRWMQLNPNNLPLPEF